MEFSSLNPYQNIEVIVSDSPQQLVLDLKAIRKPIKIMSIIPYGAKVAAFVMGDVTSSEIKKTKKNIKEK